MAINDFVNLLQVQSLEKKVKEHLDFIKEQNSRVLHIEKLRESKESHKLEQEKRLNGHQNNLKMMEKKLFEAEEKMRRTQKHIPESKSKEQVDALEKELKLLSPLIEELELKILESLEDIDEIKKTISEYQEFLVTSSDSLILIKGEADLIINKKKDEISHLEERIDLLLEETDRRFSEAYKHSKKKHIYNNPLTFIKSDSCHICRYVFDRNQLQNIEKGDQIEFCMGCERVITPALAHS